MIEDLPTKLAAFQGKGYVVAPAGYGKTHLIALAVGASSKRQLVLTHTYAGVNAIKKKMRALSVPASRYQVDTVASWALRVCLFFPNTSTWKSKHPQGNDWNKLYTAATGLLCRPFFERFLRSSYAGIYVDEYQDCSTQQHKLIEGLASKLPCRLVGDPMQAIFDFNPADPPVDWERHVYPHYQLLGKLQTPWRWRSAGAIELGAWLDSVSQRLRAGQTICITGPLPTGVNRISVDLNDFKNPKRLNLFYAFLGHQESVIAIHSGKQQSKNKTHRLARDLGGRFSSIEEVEGKELFGFIKKLEAARLPKEKLLLVINFAKKCCCGVAGILSAATKRGEKAKVTKATKFPDLIELANSYVSEPSSKSLLQFIQGIQSNAETSHFRRDLLNRFLQVLRKHQEEVHLTLVESAVDYQQYFRHSGRPIRHNKLIGTTLLVKGLEYDHAIVLEPESMSPKELYVALTRGAKSVTIVTQHCTIPV